MTTTYTLKVDDTSLFKVGDAYRTFVGTVLDAGTFVVDFINAAQSRINVHTNDGWVPLASRSISYNTDTLLPGNSFQLEAVTLRIGVKHGMDKVPTNRRIVYGVTPSPCQDCPPVPIPGPLPLPTRLTVPVQITGVLRGFLSENARQIVVQVKDALKAKGWVVDQSYSARAGTLPAPGVDAWVSYTDLLGTGGSGTGNSWLVMHHPGQSPAQLCFEVTVSGIAGGWCEIRIILAPAGGFAGGIIGTRPTAPNEIDGLTRQYWGTGPAGNPQFYASVWVSPDGAYTRVAWWFAGKCIAWWQFDVIQDNAGWSTPAVLIHWDGVNDYTAPANRMTITQFTVTDATGQVFKRSGIPGGAILHWQGVDEGQQPGGTNYTAAIHAGANEWTAKYPWFSPVGLDSSGHAAGQNGFGGYLIDQWWTVPAFNDGDTAGAQEFIFIQQMILHWGAGAPVTGGAGVDYPATSFYGRSTL